MAQVLCKNVSRFQGENRVDGKMLQCRQHLRPSLGSCLCELVENWQNRLVGTIRATEDKMRKASKRTIVFIMASCAVMAVALARGRYEIYPTEPGFNVRSYSQPELIYEEDSHERIYVYPTEPGMSMRSSSEPGMIIERKRNGTIVAYPTYPGTSLRDYGKPGYVIKER